MLLGYLQASIAKMQDHRKPSPTILDFGFWIREKEKRGSWAQGHKGKWRILVCSLLNLKSKI